MRIALFGGSFNPPHVGHLLAAAYVRAVAPVDRVWLLPSFQHPFGKKLTPFDDRARWCEAMASTLTGVEVCRVEAEFPGDGRTLTTLGELSRRFPGHAFRLVIGSDILRETHKWWRFDEVARLAPPIVLARSGFAIDGTMRARPELSGATFLDEVALPEVSSTEVRARLADGRDVTQLVPAEVAARLGREWVG